MCVAVLLYVGVWYYVLVIQCVFYILKSSTCIILYVMLWHRRFCIVFVYNILFILDSIIFRVVEHWSAIAGFAVCGSLFVAHVIHDNDYHV